MGTQPQLDALIELALAEDIGTGDLTTEALFTKPAQITARFVARESLVVSGLDVAARVFSRLDPSCRFKAKAKEGAVVTQGHHLATISGPVQSILTGERTALNFLRRMSGIATLTRSHVNALKGSRCRLLDTRKTTPGLRQIEKAAVRAGGGHNHRMGLFDGVMIKDNHILAAGSIAKAVTKARDRIPPTVKIEVECENMKQVRQTIAAGADIVMLDNMSPSRMAKAVQWIQGRALTEASGRINLSTIRAAADAGVDYVSVGALTHSAVAADIALDVLVRA